MFVLWPCLLSELFQEHSRSSFHWLVLSGAHFSRPCRCLVIYIYNFLFPNNLKVAACLHQVCRVRCTILKFFVRFCVKPRLHGRFFAAILREISSLERWKIVDQLTWIHVVRTQVNGSLLKFNYFCSHSCPRCLCVQFMRFLLQHFCLQNANYKMAVNVVLRFGKEQKNLVSQSKQFDTIIHCSLKISEKTS